MIARDPARQCVRVYQQGKLPSVRMQSNNVAVQLYTGNGSDISDDCAKLSYKNANKAEAMFCNILHEATIPHWAL